MPEEPARKGVQEALESGQMGGEYVDLVIEVEPYVEDHLVVAAAAGVQHLRKVA